jgi:FAD/FMN-containing dehydrogenase
MATIEALPTTMVTLEEDLITELEGRFQGPIVRPQDDDYDEVRSIWNGMIDKYPALIARATGAADVMTAVNFARENDLLLSVRGGGHNVAGNAVAEGGLMLDLSLMKSIHVDAENRTARAQPGVIWGELDRETQVFGLATPGGIVSDTGIAGLTLGGGFGWLTRKHGFAADNVISLDVVTADGKQVKASSSENSDLFWGMRGGSSNLGIATSIEYRLHPIGTQVLGGPIIYPLEAAVDALRFWRDFAQTAPEELGSVPVFRTAPPAPSIPEELHGKPVLVIILFYFGDLEEGARIMQPMREFGAPIFDGITEKPYTAHQKALDPGQPKGHRYYWKSEYLHDVSNDAIETLVAYAANMVSPSSRLAMMHLSGAISRLDEMAMAVSHRDSNYVVGINTGWANEEDDEREIQWTRDLWTALRPFSSGGVYVNFLSEDAGQDRIRAAYGEEKYERLVELKNQYDPNNLFRVNQNVKPTVSS